MGVQASSFSSDPLGALMIRNLFVLRLSINQTNVNTVINAVARKRNLTSSKITLKIRIVL
jgi:hypothetical protein